MSQRSASKTSKAKASKGNGAAVKATTKAKAQAKAPAKAAAGTQRASKSASEAKNTSLSAFGHRFDARPDRLDFRDLVYEPPLRSLPAEFPTAAHLSEAASSYVQANLVPDQGREGACTGFGLAAVVNYLLWLRELDQPGQHQPVRVSPHMFYELARRYDEWDGEDYEGSSCRGALKGFHKHGVCQEVYWPKSGAGARAETEWDVDALRRPLGVYYRINKKSVVDMQAAIAEIGAIYVSAQVHNGWDTLPTRRRHPPRMMRRSCPPFPSASGASWVATRLRWWALAACRADRVSGLSTPHRRCLFRDHSLLVPDQGSQGKVPVGGGGWVYWRGGGGLGGGDGDGVNLSGRSHLFFLSVSR